MNDKNISAHAGGGSNRLVFILTLGVFDQHVRIRQEMDRIVSYP